MKRRWFAGAIIVAWLGGFGASADVVYVKIAKAQVRSGKQASSALVAEVTQGAGLTVLAEEGLRYRVRLANGGEGYISRLAVSTEKPHTGGGLASLKGLEDDRQVSERGMAVSGRGLSEAAETMAKTSGIPPAAVASVKRMEEVAARIQTSDVATFRREGGLDR